MRCLKFYITNSKQKNYQNLQLELKTKKEGGLRVILVLKPLRCTVVSDSCDVVDVSSVIICDT